MSKISEEENNNNSNNNINNNIIQNNNIILTKNSKEDETFNRLLEIQLLIKKESGLKALCKYFYNFLNY